MAQNSSSAYNGNNVQIYQKILHNIANILNDVLQCPMDMTHMFILKWVFKHNNMLSQKFPDWVHVKTSGLPSLQVNTVLFKMVCL